MYPIRRWSTQNARPLESLYHFFAKGFHGLDSLWAVVGLNRLEGPFAAVEASLKGLLFDCRMCGRCTLLATGMTCPMNCPKGLRNGPCGGVLEDEHCEVEPRMRCVWVDAWAGATRMRHGEKIRDVLMPIDHGISGTSAWLRLTSENLAQRAAEREGGRQ